MSWAINGKEFENVTRLEPKSRYEYFIKKVADWQEIWSLWNDGWVLMGDQEQNESVPVWPHPIYAESCAVGAWLGYKPKSIALSDWLEKWTPGMIKDQRAVAVFPTSDGSTVTIEPNKLKNDLEKELSNYE